VNAATLDYKSLALAGLVQCAELVRSTATGLHVDEAARTAVIQAITTHDARDLAEVFPDPALLRPGVAAAIATLSGENDRVDILRYTLQLVDLAGRLKRSPVVTQRLAGGLDRLGSQPQDVALAGLYQETISTLGKRIQVTGNPAVNPITGIPSGITSCWYSMTCSLKRPSEMAETTWTFRFFSWFSLRAPSSRVDTSEPLPTRIRSGLPAA